MRTTPQPTALELMLTLTPAIVRIHARVRTHDRHLADQLRRAAQSVALNLSEADGAKAGHRKERLHTALGSLAETRTALRLAMAWGYASSERVAEIDAELDRVAAMSWRRLHPRR